MNEFKAVQVRINDVHTGKPTVTVRALDAATGAFYSETTVLGDRIPGEILQAGLQNARKFFKFHQAAQVSEEEAMKDLEDIE